MKERIILFIIISALLITCGKKKNEKNIKLYEETRCVKKNIEKEYLYKCFYKKEGNGFLFDGVVLNKEEIKDFFRLVFFKNKRIFSTNGMIEGDRLFLYPNLKKKYDLRFDESLSQLEIEIFYSNQINKMGKLLSLDLEFSKGDAQITTILSYNPYYTFFKKEYLNFFKPFSSGNVENIKRYFKLTYYDGKSWESEFQFTSFFENYTLGGVVGFATLSSEVLETKCSINKLIIKYFYLPYPLGKEEIEEVGKFKMTTVLKYKKKRCYPELTNFDLFVLSFLYKRRDNLIGMAEIDFEKEIDKL